MKTKQTHHEGLIEEVDDGFQAICACKGKPKKWKSQVVEFRAAALQLLRDHYGLKDEDEEEDEEQEE